MKKTLELVASSRDKVATIKCKNDQPVHEIIIDKKIRGTMRKIGGRAGPKSSVNTIQDNRTQVQREEIKGIRRCILTIFRKRRRPYHGQQYPFLHQFISAGTYRDLSLERY